MAPDRIRLRRWFVKERLNGSKELQPILFKQQHMSPFSDLGVGLIGAVYGPAA